MHCKYLSLHTHCFYLVNSCHVCNNVTNSGMHTSKRILPVVFAVKFCKIYKFSGALSYFKMTRFLKYRQISSHIQKAGCVNILEILALPRCYAVSIGSQLPNFVVNFSAPSSTVKKHYLSLRGEAKRLSQDFDK